MLCSVQFSVAGAGAVMVEQLCVLTAVLGQGREIQYDSISGIMTLISANL